MSLIKRRSFLFGLVAGICAPAIVRATSLMPVKPLILLEPAIVMPRALIAGVPRCEHCFKAWGMCRHTGGPMPYGGPDDIRLDMRLDQRVIDNLRLDTASTDRANLWRLRLS